MKKLLITLAIAVSAMTITAGTTPKKSVKATECQYGQCSQIKSDGKQCKNCCQQGKSYCWSHKDGN